MKKSNVMFILSIFIMALFIIPSSFAVDMDNSIADGIDENALNDNLNEISIENNDNFAKDSKESSILSDSGGNIATNVSDIKYNDIQSAINDNSGEFSIILGEGTYSNSKSIDYDLISGEQNTKIVINNKNIVFIGQGQDKTFIDGTNTDWLFNISDSVVTFKDISFVNALSKTPSVISASESDLTLINCTVKDNVLANSTYNSRSAISFSGGYWSYPNLNVVDCSFINNSGDAAGAAISIAHANANVTRSVFINNSAKSSDYSYDGGAIYLMSNNPNVTVDGCTFINNTGRNGGSIGSYYGGNLSVFNCEFYNSTASGKGGAIYSESLASSSSKVYLYVSNNKFEDCAAGTSEDNIYVENTILVDLDGNAKISANNTEVTFGEDKNLTILVSDGENNPISGQLEVNLTSKNNTLNQLIDFEDGIAYLPLKDLPIGVYEAVINLKSDVYSVLPVRVSIKVVGNYDYALVFVPSAANVYEGQAYIVTAYVRDYLGELSNYLNGKKVSIKWEDIDGSVHSLSGSNFIDGNTFTYDISNLELVPTKVYDIEFEIENTDDAVVVENGHFYANLTNKLPDDVIDLDIIYVDAVNGDDDEGTGEENNSLKTIQVALNLNNVLGGGKTIILKRGFYDVSTFTIKDDVTVIGEDKENVIILQTNGHKGMFFINEGLDVEFNNITFTGANNTVVPYGSVFSNYYNSKLVLNNSIFHDNAGWYGGVINNNEIGSILIVDNCNFYDNMAQDAGAICASNGLVYIYNSNFTSNQAQYVYASNKTVNGIGGAINLYGEIEAYVDNCNFIGNSAPGDDKTDSGGGAIAISATGNVTITNSTFQDNYAGVYGGAIWAVHGKIDIFGCVFVNNSAREGTTLATLYNDDTIINLTNSVIITGDNVPIGSHVIYAADDTLSVVYVDNNWWGMNRAPSLLNVNMSSRIVLALFNDDDYDLYVALRNNDGSDFEGYLPERIVALTPADKFNESLVKLGNNVNSILLNYAGDIESDTISATMDQQTVYYNYKHYPSIETEIAIGDISAILNSTVTLQANVSSNGEKLNLSTVSFYISSDDGYIYLGDADVNDGVASFDYDAEELGTFDIQAVFNGDDYYKPSVANAKLTVSIQSPTKIEANSSNIFVDDVYTIKLINLDDNSIIKDKELSIEIIDKVAKTTLNKSEKTDIYGLVYLELPSSDYTINIQFIGDNNYLPSSASANVSVSKYLTSIDINQSGNTGDMSVFLSYGDSSSKNPLANKTVHVSAIDGRGNRNNIDLVTDNEGLAKFKLDSGNYFILANFTEDDKFLAVNASINVVVSDDTDNSTDNDTDNSTDNDTDNKTDGSIFNGDDLQKLIDATSPGSTLVLSNSTFENVSNIKIDKDITIVGENATIKSAGDGNPIFVLSTVSEGLDDVEIKGIDFIVDNGDTIVLAKAENGSSPLSIDVPKISLDSNTVDSLNDNFIGESVTVLSLESERGILAPSNPINISNNTLVNGIKPFNFEVSDVSNSSDAFVPIGGNIPQRKATVIVYEDMVTTAINTNLDGRIGDYFNVTLTDMDGNPLANKFIQIGFNGKVYNKTTNETGQARLQINLGSKGTYTFAVSFLGDDNYNASFIVAKITVNLQKPKLTTANKSYKASAKTKTLTATLKSAKGNAIAGKKVTFTVNGKTYTATTNSKGVASVKVSLSTKKTYSFTAKYVGDTRYAAISVKGTVKIT